MNTRLYAVIEAGGTKFNCAVVNKNREIINSVRIPTTTPQETLEETIAFFTAQRQSGIQFDSLGLACFGPVDLRHDSPTYGYITKTPKPHWSNVAIAPIIEQRMNCRVVMDTDVNGAALAEYQWGASKGTDVSIYITIGTGVGGGVVVNGKPLHGLVHPEIGHMLIPAPEGIQGVCPFHGNCVEGLASGTALGKIWQQPAETLPDDHKVWDIQAQVLASLCHNLLMTFSAQRIVLGGGVMQKPGLLERIQEYTARWLNSYIVFPEGADIQSIIRLPGLGEHSGLFGALALVLDE